MSIIKNTKIIVTTVAVMLAIGVIAFAAGAGKETPAVVVQQTSDLLGGSDTSSGSDAAQPAKPTPRKTTYTTSYPQAKHHKAATTKAAKKNAATKQAASTPAAPAPATTSAPTPSAPAFQAPEAKPAPTETPTPLTWLVRTLTSGL